jgi:biotin carboxyl carrier protein
MAQRVVTLRDRRGREHKVEVDTSGSVAIDGRTLSVTPARRGEIHAGERLVWVAAHGSERWVFIDGAVHILELVTAGAPLDTHAAASGSRSKKRPQREGALSAPMPATVIKIAVSPGDHVKAGDLLIVLEAMKMELPVRASADGVVKAVRCRQGELVQPGEELVEFAAAAESAG